MRIIVLINVCIKYQICKRYIINKIVQTSVRNKSAVISIKKKKKIKKQWILREKILLVQFKLKLRFYKNFQYLAIRHLSSVKNSIEQWIIFFVVRAWKWLKQFFTQTAESCGIVSHENEIHFGSMNRRKITLICS